MPQTYIPASQSALADWATNFSSVLSANPGNYGTTAPVAADITALSVAYSAALLSATNGATRGPATVQAKNDARANLLAVVRPLAVSISLNSGISAEDKVAIGVTVRGTGPTPVPTPSTMPILSTTGITPGVITVQFNDQNTPNAKRKPFGAIGLLLFAKASSTPITDPAALTFAMFTGRQPVALSTSPGDSGKTVYMAARWVTRSGLVGPWSAVTSAVAW